MGSARACATRAERAGRSGRGSKGTAGMGARGPIPFFIFWGGAADIQTALEMVDWS